MTDQQLKDLGWWPTYASGVLVKTNDGFREAYYKEKGKWPSGVDLNGNTIYFKFHLTADGSFLTYANGNGDFKIVEIGALIIYTILQLKNGIIVPKGRI